MGKSQIYDLQLVFNAFRAISAANKQDLENAAARLGLDSSIQLNILVILYCNQGVRITTIAEWTFWHTSSIVIHVRKMTEKGLVSIEKSELDGRVVNVYITEEGRNLIYRYFNDHPQLFRLTKALKGLEERYSPAVLELFKELLDFIATGVQGEEKLSWLKESSNSFNTLEEHLMRGDGRLKEEKSENRTKIEETDMETA